MTRLASCLLLALFLAPATSAAELAGVEIPDSVTVDGTELQLNGMGLREKMWIDVYVAGLYLESKSTDAQQIVDSDQIKRLDMKFIYKKVGTKKLTGAWTDGLKANESERFADFADDLATLNSWMEDVVRGDDMIFTTVPGKGLRVEVKGQEKGVIEDAEFAKAFWSIFLGAKPPSDKFKRGLLGG